MARPKKKVEETKPVENKEKETKTTQGITYEGRLNVQIKRGGKTISSSTYKNTGRTKLFKFLADCMTGVYSKDSRPCKLILFKKNIISEDEDPANDKSWDFTASCKATPDGIVYTNAAFSLIEPISGEITGKEGYEISYEFKIPFSYITADIYKAAMYPNLISDSDTDRLAYFGFVKKNQATGETNWDEIKKPNDGEEYTLLLVWTMTINNK